MKNKSSDEQWFLIIAKDNSCRGYIPAKGKEEACEKFGLKVEQCSIKRVIRTKEGFVEIDKVIQGKLL